MILNGKAKEDFSYKYNMSNFNEYSEVLQNALIIEFFDSIGIYILPKRFTHCLEFQDWYFIITNKKGVHLNNYLEVRIKNDSRQEATQQAIKKANDIYNERTSL